MLMALSNKFGAIVLSTGNKSELGVGYCTLYGDMVGGLAVISDVPKTLVYRLSHYVNSRRAVIPQATPGKAAFGRVAARPERQRLAAALRSSRRRARRLRGRLPSGRADRNGSRLRHRSGAARDPHGGSRRIQAPAGGARPQDFSQGLRLRPPLPDCRQERGLKPGRMRKRDRRICSILIVRFLKSLESQM